MQYIYFCIYGIYVLLMLEMSNLCSYFLARERYQFRVATPQARPLSSSLERIPKDWNLLISIYGSDFIKKVHGASCHCKALLPAREPNVEGLFVLLHDDFSKKLT